MAREKAVRAKRNGVAWVDRLLGEPHVVGTLGDLCAGRVPGRGAAGEITLFKSVGTALADLAAAALVHARLSSSPGESDRA